MEFSGRLAPVGNTVWEGELKVCFDGGSGFETVEDGTERLAVSVSRSSLKKKTVLGKHIKPIWITSLNVVRHFGF